MDVLEHQILHHVFHLRCKFCRFESREYDLMDGPSLKDYKEAVTFKKYKDARTCSYCWKVLSDSYDMKKHEKSLHEKCEKSYMNLNALKYHTEKHNEPSKFKCNTCGKQYLSIKGLSAHEDIVHGSISPPEFPCDECDKSFTTRSHLKRHKKTVHSDFFES